MKKRLVLGGVCLLLVSTTTGVRADAPVIDVTAIGEQIQQVVDDLKSYALQVKQYIGEELSWAVQAQQYAMQAQQYATEAMQLVAFVHNPSLGAAMGLLNQVGLGSALPVSPYALMGMVNGSAFNGPGGIPNIAGIFAPLAALSGSAYAANHIYTPTDNSWNSRQLVGTGNGLAATQGTAMASYQQLQQHSATLPAIRDHLNTATTPKDVQDAQAEVELENLWTTNQTASLAALQITAAQQDQVRVQRDNESLDAGIDTFLAQASAAGMGL